MIEQNDSGNGNVDSTLVQSEAGRLIYGQLITPTDTDIFKFVPDLNPTLEDGVGFTATIRINENFSAQAGWKLSLVDASEYVIAAVDSADVAEFAADRQLQLSGSYDASKPLYVKVESSDSANHSSAQYELLVQEHNQLDEDVNGKSYASLQGDIVSHSNFEFTGVATTDTDQFVFETLAADSATDASVVYIDTSATIDLDFANSTGEDISNGLTSTIHGSEITISLQAFTVEFGDVDSDTVTLTLQRADGSYIHDENGADVNSLAVDLNSPLSVQLSANSDPVGLTVTAKSSSDVAASVRVLDGSQVVASDGTSISSFSHGVPVDLSLPETAQAYAVDVTSATNGDYTIQVEGLAARQNTAPTIQVRDYVSTDYKDGLPYLIENGIPDYSNLPIILVDKLADLNLSEVFKVGDSDFANVYFFSNDTTPIVGVGGSSNATAIAAANYKMADNAQVLDLSSYSAGDEFTIMSFASNSSLLASNANYLSEDQYNTSGIVGAKIVISDQGIGGSLAASSIREGDTTTLTLNLSEAIVGGDTIEVSLANASGDLLFDGVTSKTVTFDASKQTIDVLVKAVSGDIDFADSENVGIQITPLTAAYQNLLISDVALSVTEVTPSFSMATNVLSVVNDTDYYQYTVTLDNASDFAAANPVSVAVTAPSGFVVSESAGIADALSAAVEFSTDNPSATWSVLADATAVPDVDIPNEGLLGQIVHAITYGSRQLTGLDQLTVTRAVEASTSTVGLAGTSGDDAIATTAAQESITSLAGDDTVTYTQVSDMSGDSYDGGDGADTVSLPGLKTDYTAQTLINNSYRLTANTNSEVLEISNVETLIFTGDGSTIASSDLNQDPSVQSGVVPTGGYSLLEGATKVIDLSDLFVDPESDKLYYNVTLDGGPKPAWVQFDSDTQALTLTPSASDPGTYSFGISARDNIAEGTSDPSINFDIVVSDIPNVSAAVSDASLMQGVALDLDLKNVFTDVDVDDILAIEATQADGAPLPDWLDFDDQLLKLAGTPANGDIGELDVILKAVDLDGNINSDSFKITVANVNDTPILNTDVADASVIEGQTINIPLAGHFSDIDIGDSLEYAVIMENGLAAPDWLLLNPSTGVLTANPTADDLGSLSLVVTAKDNFDAFVSDSFFLLVQTGSDQVTIITGTDADEVISGTSGDDDISPLKGADVVYALAGEDDIILTADATWGTGYSAMNVSNDQSVGTNEKISLEGLNKFSDVIDGGDDVDTLILTTGNDAFFIDDVYSDHHSSLTLSSTTQGTDSIARIIDLEAITAGEGNDIVDLTSANFILAEAIKIYGESGNDTLWGSNGHDTIDGGDDNDTLFGGAGNDILIGGDGADVFQFTATSGSDVIADLGNGDSVELHYRAEDNHTNADLNLVSGVLTWNTSGSENVSIDLSDTITSSNFNDVDDLITFVEIIQV